MNAALVEVGSKHVKNNAVSISLALNLYAPTLYSSLRGVALVVMLTELTVLSVLHGRNL